MIINALSIDVEEYYHGVEFEAAIQAGRCSGLPSRVESSVDRVLTLLAAHKVYATFFTVGAVAEAHPEMLKGIAAAGHEIACHSYRHELVARQTAGEFRQDIRRAKAILEDISGQPILGYRAPNFRINRDQTWFHDILLEEDFRYDSSSYPIVHDRYGQADAVRFPHIIRQNGDQGLIEFPVGTCRIGGVNWPIGGGGYFRLLPPVVFQRGISHVNKREKRPTMFYFHPWELDPDQPRPPMPWQHRFRHYVGLARQAGKLSWLFQNVRFAPVKKVLGLRI